MFQLDTKGVVFDGKVKPIGRSEQIEIDVFKKDGTALIVTVALSDTAAQPPAAATVQVTIYVPAVLELGVIAPVLVFNVKPVKGGAGVPDVEVTEYIPGAAPV